MKYSVDFVFQGVEFDGVMRTCDTDFRKFHRTGTEPVGVKQGQFGVLLSARSLLNTQGNSGLLILSCWY